MMPPCVAGVEHRLEYGKLLHHGEIAADIAVLLNEVIGHELAHALQITTHECGVVGANDFNLFFWRGHSCQGNFKIR